MSSYSSEESLFVIASSSCSDSLDWQVTDFHRIACGSVSVIIIIVSLFCFFFAKKVIETPDPCRVVEFEETWRCEPVPVSQHPSFVVETLQP